jgi:hypothetical protein
MAQKSHVVPDMQVHDYMTKRTFCGILTPLNPNKYQDGWTRWPMHRGFLIGRYLCEDCLESAELAMIILGAV